MESTNPKAVQLRDYRAPAYRIPDVALTFEIFSNHTVVTSNLSIQRSTGRDAEPLVLQGEKVELLGLRVDGRKLTEREYKITQTELVIPGLPEQCRVEVTTKVRPRENRSGLGLYQSHHTICTQMEAEGFRRVTYFSDRPDVMSRYVVTIRADRKEFPVLLANGDCVSTAALGAERHEVVYRDPFPKPCYLFALVAGDLGKIEDRFVTMSGRVVTLQIFCEHGDERRCEFAMESLKKAMRWDEEVFRLEYDLNTFVIVAVNDFNFGAMENKGLNIFNASYVLADAESATDEDYFNIERVIAHEYFHNWTGNRVTLRDWFQLTLKEGLTVLRDQEFSGDMNSRAVERIRNARTIRDRQFVEDAGPNAHPIRPESYIEIDNFYTNTVYRKGAEVIGMLKTLLGTRTFIDAVQEYLRRFDGQAVTTEQFLEVMEEVGKRDLTQFRRWYFQAGTPRVEVHERYAPGEGTYSLTLRQACPPTPGQAHKEPFLIPFAVGLVAADGTALPVQLEGEHGASGSTRVLELTQPEQTFVFKNISQKPIPSLLRDFSAPVIVEFNYSDDDLAFLLAHDEDPYNRFEAGQRLGLRYIRRAVDALQGGRTPEIDDKFSMAFGNLLSDQALDPAFRAQALVFPSLVTICDSFEQPDFDRILAARRFVVRSLEAKNRELFLSTYRSLSEQLGGEYQRDALSMGKRALKNICLGYLAVAEQPESIALANRQYVQSRNMTDCYAAFQALMITPSAAKDSAIESFFLRWKNDPVVLDFWIVGQLAVAHLDALEVVLALEKRGGFDPKSPNKLQALYGTFGQNLPQFHRSDGRGYALLADRIIEIDRFNPNVSAGLAKSFHWYRRLDAGRKVFAKTHLERILGTKELSKGLFEIVQRTLSLG